MVVVAVAAAVVAEVVVGEIDEVQGIVVEVHHHEVAEDIPVLAHNLVLQVEDVHANVHVVVLPLDLQVQGAPRTLPSDRHPPKDLVVLTTREAARNRNLGRGRFQCIAPDPCRPSRSSV